MQSLLLWVLGYILICYSFYSNESPILLPPEREAFCIGIMRIQRVKKPPIQYPYGILECLSKFYIPRSTTLFHLFQSTRHQPFSSLVYDIDVLLSRYLPV